MTPLGIIWIFAGFLACGLLGWVGGFFSGWTSGIKDTERRWREAVGRGGLV
jgi:hypothetical protein